MSGVMNLEEMQIRNFLVHDKESEVQKESRVDREITEVNLCPLLGTPNYHS